MGDFDKGSCWVTVLEKRNRLKPVELDGGDPGESDCLSAWLVSSGEKGSLMHNHKEM